MTDVHYVHAADCSWLKSSWCDCGLDEIIERAIHDEAVVNADRLYAMSEAASEVARDLRGYNPGHGDFLTAGRRLSDALTAAEASVVPPDMGAIKERAQQSWPCEEARMSNLTDAERDELHHAVLRDVIAAGETVPNVHATAETIVAAHVQAERDRLLALAAEFQVSANYHTSTSAAHWVWKEAAMKVRALAEERAR